MSVDAFARQQWRMAALLVVDGLPVAFYGGLGVPPAPPGRTLAPGLLDFGAVDSRLDPIRATPEDASVTVRLAVTPQTRALLRAIPDGAPSLALAGSMPPIQAAAPLVVEVDRNPTGIIPAPGLAYVGQEAVEVSAISAAPPFTITIPAGGRGQLGTPIQSHTYQPELGRQPRVFGACVAWRRRSARLIIGEVGTPGAWRYGAGVTLLEGYISGVPQVTRDATIEVQLSSLPSALRVKVGGPDVAAGLQPGWHLFEGEVGRYWLHAQAWLQGAAYSQQPVNLVAAGVNVVVDVAPGALEALFDLAAPAESHRSALVQAMRELFPSRVTATVVDPGGLDVPGTITLERTQATGLDTLRNVRREVTIRADLAGGPGPVVVERAGILGAVTQALAAAVPGGGDVWAVGDAADDGITVKPGWTPATPGALLARVPRYTRAACWGWLFDGEAAYLDTGGAVRHPSEPARPWEPSMADVEVRAGEAGQGLGQTLATAWWQPGEPRMLVSGNITPGATPATPTYVIATTEREGEERRIVHRVVGSVAASTITPGAPGFALTIDGDGGGLPLVDSPGRPAVQVQPCAAWRGVSAARILFELIRSRHGVDPGTGDAQPYGAGVAQGAVDALAFAALDADPLGGRTLLLDEGAELMEVASDLARSSGFLLVERLNRSTLARQLTLTRAGLPTPREVVAVIDDGDWLADGRPVCQMDEALVTRITYECSAGDPFTTAPDDLQTFTVTVVNADAEGEQGPGAGDSIKLLGAAVPVADLASQREMLLPLAAARFAAYSYPRRVVDGSLAYAKGAAIYAGAVVRVAAREALDPSGQPLQGYALGRVVALSADPLGAGFRVRVVYWPTVTAGWAPALRVTAGAGGVTVTVAANEFAPAQDAGGSPQADLDFFAPGDEVLCVVPGDRGASVAATIVSIMGQDVTLSVASPAGTARLRPLSWATAAPSFVDFCFQASGSPAALPGGDAAKVYV